MKKILLRLMDYGLKGVDTYTYNGSVWLIFTDTKQWVLELTSEKTLWYNYTFFKQLFCVATSDVTAQDKFITEWAEKNMIKPLYSTPGGHTNTETINDVIDNGVRETKSDDFNVSQRLSEDVIENGIKETHHVDVMKFFDNKMNEAIENGVKETYEIDWDVPIDIIDDVIDSGVNETIAWNDSIIGDLNQNGCIDAVIKEGVKEIKTPGKENDYRDYMEWMENRDTYSVVQMVDDIIDGGVKETKVSDYNGDGVDFYITDQSLVDTVVENGIKETKVCNYVDPETGLVMVKWGNQIDNVIDCGKKISGTFVGGKLQESKTSSVINYGIKETEPMDDWVNTNRIVTDVIDNGIKETKTPGDDGDIVGVMNWMLENKTNSVPKMIDDIIKTGIKETKCANKYDSIGPVFKQHKIDNVIENGTKNPTD